MSLGVCIYKGIWAFQIAHRHLFRFTGLTWWEDNKGAVNQSASKVQDDREKRCPFYGLAPSARVMTHFWLNYSACIYRHLWMHQRQTYLHQWWDQGTWLVSFFARLNDSKSSTAFVLEMGFRNLPTPMSCSCATYATEVLPNLTCFAGLEGPCVLLLSSSAPLSDMLIGTLCTLSSSGSRLATNRTRETRWSSQNQYARIVSYGARLTVTIFLKFHRGWQIQRLTNKNKTSIFLYTIKSYSRADVVVCG